MEITKEERRKPHAYRVGKRYDTSKKGGDNMKSALLAMYQFVLTFFTPYYTDSLKDGNITVFLFAVGLSLWFFKLIGDIAKEFFNRKPNR